MEAPVPDPQTIVLFVTSSIVLLAIPGPTIALVIARSLAQGRRVAVPLVLGVGLGDLMAASIALAGAGALLATSATAFTIVKWIGAAYLVWLGIRLFRSEPKMLAAGEDFEAGDALGALRDGFLVTLFNPKGILFFVAFVPQFIDAGKGYLPQATFFVATFTLLGIANGAAYALGADTLRRLVRKPAVLRAMNRVGGTVIAAAGVAALFTRRPAL
jgi:threonine/homoserine/homoserine lactone efflux protein